MLRGGGRGVRQVGDFKTESQPTSAKGRKEALAPSLYRRGGGAKEEAVSG